MNQMNTPTISSTGSQLISRPISEKPSDGSWRTSTPLSCICLTTALVEKPSIGATVRNGLPSFSLPLMVAGWSALIVAVAMLPLSTLCTNEL